MYRQSEKNAEQQYLLHMFSQYGEHRLTNGGDRFWRLGYPRKFQRVSRLAFVTAATSLTGGQPNLARCLSVFWAATLYIHFRRLLPRNAIFPGAKFTLRPSPFAFSYIGIVTAQHSNSRRQPNLAAWYKEWN